VTEALHLNAFQLEFTDEVKLLLQEKSKLRDTVNMGSHNGSESASPVNQVASIDATSPAGRFADLQRTDPQHERRWVDPEDYEISSLLDNFDMARYSQDYKNPYAETHAMALARAMDDVIIAATSGAAKIGKRGAGSEAFDTTNLRVAATVGASGSTGLNVPKLIRARRLFQSQNVDLDAETPTLLISPIQEENLLNQTEVTSGDFNSSLVLENGRLRSFMGFNFIVSNRTQTGDVPFGFSSGSVRRCPVWVKSGVHLGIWKEPQSRVDERKDKSSIPWQIYSCMTIGATRTEQGRVLEILCDES
jgi:hypothetical protein